jgi:hypothetical protein
MGTRECVCEHLPVRWQLLSRQLRHEGLHANTLHSHRARDRLAESIPVMRKTHPSRQFGCVLPAVRENDEFVRDAWTAARNVSKQGIRENLRNLLKTCPQRTDW